MEKRKIRLIDYADQALPLQNVNEEGQLQTVEDMVDLPYLHEAAILYNLKARHMRGKPYTRTGDIVIACNPYQWLDHLYTASKRWEYAQALVWNTTTSNEIKKTTSPQGQQQGKESKADGTPPNRMSWLEPHIYESASLAYRGLAVDGMDQSILVSGESGAGKTESVKICLRHIASVQRGVNVIADIEEEDNDTQSTPASSPEALIVQRVLDSNPLLEAFGNAKTIRNDNSSRFGKFLQLQFDTEDPVAAAFCGKAIPSACLAGSKCEVYLLEKSRVVQHDEENERTYHIFYQLLAAPDEVKTTFWSGLANTDMESFCYVGYTDTHSIEGVTDAERFQQTIQSLDLIGIRDDKLKTLMRAICIVMQLGNLVFEPDPQDDAKSYITSEEELDGLADLMGMTLEDDRKVLTAALTIRTMRAKNEEFKVPLNAIQAKDSCDAFAKEIYAKTFLWLVRAINDATCAEWNYEGAKKTGFGNIGLLDIFGFESFDVNRFEQLCINYANEKLQQKFTQDIFRSVQQEYEMEGIELDEIRYDDNTDVLDLIEGRMGLLAILNEECVRPGGSDKGFVSKVQAVSKDSPCFIKEDHSLDREFGVKHYAGEVMYDATGFVTKNMDSLPMDLQDCAKRSANAILANELENEAMMNPEPSSSSGKDQTTETKRPAAAKKRPSPKAAAATRTAAVAPSLKKKGSYLVGLTVWTKFKGQLTDLMSTLSKTRTRYIRCIKPNAMKEPLVMQHKSTVEQLRCAGVVAAVTISRSAFPNRVEHENILDRFKSLWEMEAHTEALKEAAEIEDVLQKSRFLADRLLTLALKALEVHDGALVTKAFVMGRTRAYFRAGALEHLEAQRLRRLGVWAVKIEKVARGFVAHRQYKRKRWVSIRLESLVRTYFAVKAFRLLRQSIITVQCWSRCIQAARLLVVLRRNHAATLVQTQWRRKVAADDFCKCRLACVIIQAMCRGAIQRPKFRAALHEKREEAKLENQVRALQRKLEEAEARRLEAEKEAEERAKKAVEEYRESAGEEKKLDAAANASIASGAASVTPSAAAHEETSKAEQISAAQQQALMDESGKMLEYLRKEVFRLRSQNAQMRADFDLLKDNNQRLMDANASAGASFAALNQHGKILTRTNEKLMSELASYKQQVQKLSVTQVELKEELKMKQATYVAEVHSRLQYQKALAKIVDMVQERGRDVRLVEDCLRVADECEAEYMSGPTGLTASVTRTATSLFSTPSSTPKRHAASGSNTNPNDSSTFMSSIRSLWS